VVFATNWRYAQQQWSIPFSSPFYRINGFVESKGAASISSILLVRCCLLFAFAVISQIPKIYSRCSFNLVRAEDCRSISPYQSSCLP
jgi:hypothetical protein